MTPPPTQQQDFRVHLRALWRWKYLLLLFLLVIPAVSYFLEERRPDEYGSNALVQVQGVTIDSSLFQGSAPAGNFNILAVARLVETTAIAKAAAKLLHPPPRAAASLLGQISVKPDDATGFIDISAVSSSPRRAADIANAFALAISANRAAAAIEQLDFAIRGVRRQLDGLPSEDRVGRSQLSAQLQRLRALRASQGRNAAIIERAVPSAAPLGRGTRRAIELGIVIALLLGIGAVALAEASDRRLRAADQVEEVAGAPLLSAIPGTAFSSLSKRARDDEAFQMLRAALTYFNVDRRVASVVITSPGQDDGKTTVAIRLALALAEAGKSVILVDCDLRHPRIASRFGLENGRGLADVLVGETALSDALVEVSFADRDEGDAPMSGRMRMLPAGEAVPNPAELLSSTACQRLISALEVQADFVVIDTAAALAVSDALPLLQWASGVLLVARLNRTTKAAVRRLTRVIAAANGTILGVVATGATSKVGYEYGYGYGYAPAKEGRRKRRSKRRRAKRRSSLAVAVSQPDPTQPAPGEPQEQT